MSLSKNNEKIKIGCVVTPPLMWIFKSFVINSIVGVTLLILLFVIPTHCLRQKRREEKVLDKNTKKYGMWFFGGMSFSLIQAFIESFSLFLYGIPLLYLAVVLLLTFYIQKKYLKTGTSKMLVVVSLILLIIGGIATAKHSSKIYGLYQREKEKIIVNRELEKVRESIDSLEIKKIDRFEEKLVYNLDNKSTSTIKEKIKQETNWQEEEKGFRGKNKVFLYKRIGDYPWISLNIFPRENTFDLKIYKQKPTLKDRPSIGPIQIEYPTCYGEASTVF